MSTNIQLLRSSIANKRPAPATLLDGQAAVNLNTVEPGLFFKLSNGSLSKIGPVCVNSTGNAPNSTPSGSSGNAVGETWLDGRTAFSSPVLKVYNGATWQASSGFTVDNTNGNFSLSKQITGRNFIATGQGQYSYNKLPAGPTTDESLIASPQAGYIRYDSTLNALSYYDGNSWQKTVAQTGCSILPTTNNACNLGSGSLKWANVYSTAINSTTITNSGVTTSASYSGNALRVIGGEVVLNSSNGSTGTTYVGRDGQGTGPVIPTGQNCLVVGNDDAIGLPIAVLGRDFSEPSLYQRVWANFFYGGSDQASIATVTGNGGATSNWKDNIDLSQFNGTTTTFTYLGSFQTQVNTNGVKLYLENATNGFEVTPRSTAGNNQAVCMTFNKRTGTTEDPAGQISAGGQGAAAFIRITSTDGSAPASLTLTDTRNVTSSAALPDPTTAIKALTPQLLTLASGKIVASFPATHTRTKIADMVHGTDNATDSFGADELVGVDHANLVPFLTKALQALIARVETLEAAP